MDPLDKLKFEVTAVGLWCFCSTEFNFRDVIWGDWGDDVFDIWLNNVISVVCLVACVSEFVDVFFDVGSLVLW